MGSNYKCYISLHVRFISKVSRIGFYIKFLFPYCGVSLPRTSVDLKTGEED